MGCFATARRGGGGGIDDYIAARVVTYRYAVTFVYRKQLAAW